MKRRTTVILALGVLALAVAAPVRGWSQAKEIKCATIAPAGSAWDKIFVAMNDELKQRTNGQVAFKIYAGGVQGDEKAVVQKIRSGQLGCGGLTGFGLGMIAPSVRVLEVPFLFSSEGEIDSRTSKVTPQLEKALASGNPPVELLGWAEAGFVYIMSNKPIAKLSDMKGVKMWMWEGDPVAEAMFRKMNLTPIQLTLPDVLTSLQTGVIEGVYAPPMGAVALQWTSRVKYYTDLPLVNSIGALVVAKSEFSKLSGEQQKILKEVGQKYCRQIVDQTRSDNRAALSKLESLGIKKVPVADTDKQELMGISKAVGQDLIGKLYSADLLTAVQGQ
jgi:TRAP-type C4-dicarboxylate transport system substrate-binding protein